MAGQLIPKGDRKWLVRVFRGRDPKTGKKKYFNKLVYGNKKDAQTYLNKLLRDIDQGTFVDPTPLTLDEYLDRWLEAAAKPRLAPLTFEHYKDVLKRYVRPALGSHKVSNLRPLDVQTLYSEMQGRNLSPRIVRYTHAILNSALKQAARWGLIAQNPASLVELPKKVQREMQAMTPEQAQKFLEAAKMNSHSVLFHLALETGMRPSEYFGLQWKDVNFEISLVTVQRTLTWQRDGTWYFGEPKTLRSRRNIPLSPSLLGMMREHKRKQAEERLKAGAKYQNLNLVFCTHEGGPLRLHNLLTRHYRPILKNAKLPMSFRLYDLRHTCATLLLLAGVNPKIVSERLGHSSVVMTLDTYSHVLPSMQQSATAEIERMIYATK